jgi:hypothetical protein
MVDTQRPPSCRRWLADPDATADLRRPNRTRYVIDLVPDFITVKPRRPPRPGAARAKLDRHVALVRSNDRDAPMRLALRHEGGW